MEYKIQYKITYLVITFLHGKKIYILHYRERYQDHKFQNFLQLYWSITYCPKGYLFETLQFGRPYLNTKFTFFNQADYHALREFSGWFDIWIWIKEVLYCYFQP